MTRPVCFSAADTYSGRSGSRRGALVRALISASVPLGVIVRQSTGQMSMQASHSMHSGALNTVWMSQLRQRCTSSAVCVGSKPSSTSVLICLNRSASATCGTRRRSAGL